MPEGDDVDAVRSGEAGLSTGDDAEGGELRQLGFRQPRAELGEVGDSLRIAILQQTRFAFCNVLLCCYAISLE